MSERDPVDLFREIREAIASTGIRVDVDEAIYEIDAEPRGYWTCAHGEENSWARLRNACGCERPATPSTPTEDAS